MQRRQFLGLTLSAAGALVLSGCGFHLRGLEEGGILTLEQLAVAGNEGPFADMLVQRLEDYGVQVRDDAPLRLNLSTENASYRQLSTLDSGTQDGQLVLNVPYSIQRTSDNAYLQDRQSVEVVEDYSLASDNLLSQDDVREDALENARREAVRQMIERLRSLQGS